MSEPLVLLPGMMCDARVFMPQLTDLARDHAVTVAPVRSSTDNLPALTFAMTSS